MTEAGIPVAANQENAFLPMTVERKNITQLTLINFEEDPEKVYRALELQHLENKDSAGWRVLAYRKDGYLDVYDDKTLPADPEEDFQVAGKGAKEHVNTPMANLRFEKDERENVHISFSFEDVEGRSIHVAIEEGINKSSTPFNLLAPIGLGSEKPDYFPLFWLYDFNFIRTKDLRFEISIDGREIEPDLDLLQEQEGVLNIVTDDGMGYLRGHYSLEETGSSQLQFRASFDEGWKANVLLFTHKMFVNDRSVFAAWRKQYDYTLDIDLDTKETESRWENHQEGN